MPLRHFPSNSWNYEDFIDSTSIILVSRIITSRDEVNVARRILYSTVQSTKIKCLKCFIVIYNFHWCDISYEKLFWFNGLSPAWISMAKFKFIIRLF